MVAVVSLVSQVISKPARDADTDVVGGVDGSGRSIIGDRNRTNRGDAVTHGKALVGRGGDGGGPADRNGITVFIVGTAIVTDFEFEIVSRFGGGKGGKAKAAYGDVITGIEVRRHSND